MGRPIALGLIQDHHQAPAQIAEMTPATRTGSVTASNVGSDLGSEDQSQGEDATPLMAIATETREHFAGLFLIL